MAVLRVQAFHIEVFLTDSLLQTQPDIVDEVPAVTLQFAVQRVMQANDVSSAAVIYIRSRCSEVWLYEVCSFPDGIEYSNPVKRSL